MVEEEKRYVCEVCHKRYDSKEDAKECENSEPEKISIEVNNTAKVSRDWQAGDFVVKGVFNLVDSLSSLVFGRIVNTDIEVEKHSIRPVVVFLDGKRETLDRTNRNVVLLKKEEMEKVRNWVEKEKWGS